MIMMIESDEQRSFVEDIYYKYRWKMMAICVGILKNSDDAQDALSDAFAHIIEDVERFQEVENREGFLLVTTRNIAINLYNQKNNQLNRSFSSTMHEKEAFQSKELDLPDLEVDPEQIAMDHLLVDEIKELLKTMPEELSIVIVYKYLYNFRNSEIAKMLGIDRTLVNVRLYRARQKLQKLLQQRKYTV